MDREQNTHLDEALARMRAAFADKSDDEIMEDVLEIIERDRRSRTSVPAYRP